jgi:phenylalanyl-tRNA synthetase alpha chain
MQNLDAILHEALAQFKRTEDAAALEQVKARYLGKSGVLTELLKSLGKLPAKQRPAEGQRINQAKETLEAALQERRNALNARKLETQLAQNVLDVTLPGRGLGVGGLHHDRRRA